MKITTIIGLIGRVFPFNSIGILLLFCSSSLLSSCGISKQENCSNSINENPIELNDTCIHYDSFVDPLSELDVYGFVEKFPSFNGQSWQNGLGKEFSRKFSYNYSSGEEICYRVVAQFIINENGELIFPRIIECNNELFGKAVLNTIQSCQDWTPGMIGDKKVNTILTMSIIW